MARSEHARSFRVRVLGNERACVQMDSVFGQNEDAFTHSCNESGRFMIQVHVKDDKLSAG